MAGRLTTAAHAADAGRRSGFPERRHAPYASSLLPSGLGPQVAAPSCFPAAAKVA
ncbi:hypothetical protein ACWCRD_20770 [Streptomyces sp. NPDC002092]